MVALVQAELEVKGLVVEGDVGEVGARQGRDADLALAEVAVYGIDRAVLAFQGGGHFIQIRVVDAPEMLVLEGDLEGDGGASFQLLGRFGLAAVLELDGQAFAFGGRLGQDRVHAYLGGVDVRGEVQALDVVTAAGLEVDGLPDAAGIAIALLAVEVGVGGRVIGLDQQLLRFAETDAFQLAFEGSVAALVGTDFRAVQPGCRLPVGSTDHQEDPLAFPLLGDGDLPAVPGDVAFVFDLGELGSPGEGDQDAAPERSKALVSQGLVGCGRVEGEGPVTIEVDPLRTLEVRPRMLRQGNGYRLFGGAGAGEKETCSGAEGLN